MSKVNKTIVASLVSSIFNGIHAHAKILPSIVEARQDATYVADDAVEAFMKRLDAEVKAGKIAAATATTYKSQYRTLLTCDLELLMLHSVSTTSVQTCYGLVKKDQIAAAKDAGKPARGRPAKAKEEAKEEAPTVLGKVPDTMSDALDVLTTLRAMKVVASHMTVADAISVAIDAVRAEVKRLKDAATLKAKGEKLAKGEKTAA